MKKHYVNKEILRAEIRACKEKFESHIAGLDDPDRDTIEKVAVKYCSPELYKMIDLIVNGMASKPNFRYYSDLEGFKNTALIVLMTRWYKFDLDGMTADKIDDDGTVIKGVPYSTLAYYSQVTFNSFRTSIKAEAKQKKVRESILEYNGQLASWSTQVDNDEQHRLRRLAKEGEEENLDHT